MTTLRDEVLEMRKDAERRVAQAKTNEKLQREADAHQKEKTLSVRTKKAVSLIRSVVLEAPLATTWFINLPEEETDAVWAACEKLGFHGWSKDAHTGARTYCGDGCQGGCYSHVGFAFRLLTDEELKLIRS